MPALRGQSTDQQIAARIVFQSVDRAREQRYSLQAAKNLD